MSLEQQEYWGTHSRPMELEEGTIVENWLRSLDLIYYTQDFLDNGYDDLEVCKQIGEDDLNAIGVLEESHRAHILQAVKTLQEKGGTAVYFTLEERPTVYEDYALVGVGGQCQRHVEGEGTEQEEGGQKEQDVKADNTDAEVKEHTLEEGDTLQVECPPVPSTVGTITTVSQEEDAGEGVQVQVQVETHEETVAEGVTTVVEDYADLPPPPPSLLTSTEGTPTSLRAPDHPPPPPPLLPPGDCPPTTSLSCGPLEEVPQCSTSSSCGGCDAYGEGKRALTAYPRLQLASLMRDRLMEEGITLDTATSVSTP